MSTHSKTLANDLRFLENNVNRPTQSNKMSGEALSVMTRIWLSRAPLEIKTIPNIAGDANKSESFSLPLITTHNGYLWARRIFLSKLREI